VTHKDSLTGASDCRTEKIFAFKEAGVPAQKHVKRQFLFDIPTSLEVDSIDGAT
jgi:hypothetical protein